MKNNIKNELSRRKFIQNSFSAGLGFALLSGNLTNAAEVRKPVIRMGLVTYNWGHDWDLPTLISNCEKAGYLGVELRTQHAHKVESDLTAAQRTEVKKRFADSSVTCLGYGSNYEYHSPDPAVLRKNIEGTKEYIKLCKDIGATGIKVKPNNLPPEVPKERTIAQIAASLNECGKFAKDYGQQIRVEVHGKFTSELPNMKAIFDQVTEPNVKICWNSNQSDLLPPGIEGNFNMVKKWFGDTFHIGLLNSGNYPYQQFFNLLNSIKYDGWLLLEAHNPDTPNRVEAMKEQLRLFNEMIANSKKK